ncbi:prohibitin family protein [Candidatus Synechococcus calcipolaris G9]|uniref:Prohibitin family protein n=1 Tax=Candidatus Synechococcus calcipolaris G9 TaxID=1497997 RepID=A0ABT6EZ90_9SYNE|nr:prohibitin family protein [Candidatus Synechococcus calcipolaris]MDG2990926.1 prohibitin family protein [Candidatus Synechococcus calcipolaris G9]
MKNLFSSIVAIVAFLTFLLIFNSVVIINPGEVGVLQVLGKAQDGPLLEGLHWKPPFISTVNLYDVTVQKFEVPAESATKDLQDISASFAINFRLDPLEIVQVRRTQGSLSNIVTKIIAPQTQEAFKIAAARRTAEEAITKRDELKNDFDAALGQRLAKYSIIVMDTSVVNLEFSHEFSKAVEDKQIAEQRAQRAVYIAQEASQEAQAEINRAQGKAEAQRLLAETLKSAGGQLVLQKEAIQAWREGGAKVPNVLVMGGEGSGVPFLLNLNDLKK